MTTLVLDAFQGCDFAIFDVPGAYLNADIPNEKYFRLKLEGRFVDIMCNVNPDHIPNIWYKNGKKEIYLRIMKYLYGCIESALLWYDLYVNTLK